MKHTNLIFAEHEMLLKKTDLLESQIQHYKEVVDNCEETDSINQNLLSLNKEYYETHIQNLNSQLKKTTKKKNLYKVGAIGSLALFIFALIK